MSNTNLHILGDDNLIRLFNELDPRVQKRVIAGGYRKSAKIVKDSILQEFKSVKKSPSSGKIEKSLKISNITEENNKNEVLGVKVGFISKKGYYGYVAYWLEHGTEDRAYEVVKRNIFTKRTKKYHYTGRIQATGFFESAVEKSEDQAFSTINDNIKLTFDRLVKKYEKQQKK